MSMYADHIPNGAFVVSPDYETASVIVDGAVKERAYFKQYQLRSYDVSYVAAKYHTTVLTDVVDATPEYSDTAAYALGERVKVSDYGVVFEAGTDVPAGNHPLSADSVDEAGVPYWVEADTIDEKKPFDASAETSLRLTGRGLMLTTTILQYSLPIYATPKQLIEHISLMGLRGSGEKTRMFVQFYHADLMGFVPGFENDINKCNYYNAALIDAFEIDLDKRDRVSFAIPDMLGVHQPPPPDVVDENVAVSIAPGEHIAMDIFIETRETPYEISMVNTPCGAVHTDSLVGDLQVGLVTTGKRNMLGLTKFKMKAGRQIRRRSEANYLRRRTVQSAVETIDCDIIVKTPDEQLSADYFFRIAAETSHIIHAGVPTYDWRFIFGVLDGNSPVDSEEANILSVQGYGVAFFATDPMITQPAAEGWQ